MKIKNRGFTLVEIIVSFAIAAVVMTLIGGIIISTSSFLGTTAQTDSDKLKTDEIVSIVRSDVEYSTDVRFVKEDSHYAPDYEKDTDWHYLYVKDGILYRDGTKLLDDGYYDNTKISIYLRGYKDSNHRMDFSYKLLDSDKKQLYSTRDTIMFLNLSLSDEIAEKAFVTNEKEYELSNNGYWLFYKKKATLTNSGGVVDPTVATKDGTVADIRFNINGSNYGGVYDPTKIEAYSYGDFLNVIVWYDGNWWERTNNHSVAAPGKGAGWKLLDSYYTNPYFSDTKGFYSSYQRGDIVIYQDNYYLAIDDVDDVDNDHWSIKNPKKFENLGSINDPTVIEIVKNNKYDPKVSFKKLTVGQVYFKNDIDYTDPLFPKIDEFKSGELYQIGSIVKRKNPNTDDFYDLYIKRAFVDSDLAPGTPESGWTRISSVYDYTRINGVDKCSSYYAKGDIVLVINFDRKCYIEAINDIPFDVPLSDINHPKHYWNELK